MKGLRRSMDLQWRGCSQQGLSDQWTAGEMSQTRNHGKYSRSRLKKGWVGWEDSWPDQAKIEDIMISEVSPVSAPVPTWYQRYQHQCQNFTSRQIQDTAMATEGPMGSTGTCMHEPQHNLPLTMSWVPSTIHDFFGEQGNNQSRGRHLKD